MSSLEAHRDPTDLARLILGAGNRWTRPNFGSHWIPSTMAGVDRSRVPWEMRTMVTFEARSNASAPPRSTPVGAGHLVPRLWIVFHLRFSAGNPSVGQILGLYADVVRWRQIGKPSGLDFELAP